MPVGLTEKSPGFVGLEGSGAGVVDRRRVEHHPDAKTTDDGSGFKTELVIVGQKPQFSSEFEPQTSVAPSPSLSPSFPGNDAVTSAPSPKNDKLLDEGLSFVTPMLAQPCSISPAELHFCGDCSIVQPLRTRHCRDCRACVAKYDHHCVWLGTCVGELNQGPFVLMLAAMSLLFTLAAANAFSGLLSPGKSPRNSEEGSEGALFISSIASSFAAVFAWFLLVNHCRFAARNVTTWETFRRSKISYLRGFPHVSPFDRGSVENLRSVFCHKGKLVRWSLPEKADEAFWRRAEGYDVAREGCC